MKLVPVAALAALVSVAAAGGLLAEDRSAAGPVVVELFTSQGCDACPPTDQLILQVGGRSDVLALTYNVDYWDYIGWTDTFATSANTERQRAYARISRRIDLATPQVILNGEKKLDGPSAQELEAALDRLRRSGHSTLAIAVEKSDGRLAIVLPESKLVQEATVWLVRFDRVRSQRVARGDNAGKLLVYHHVVRDIANLGLWFGERREIYFNERQLAEDGADGCAVLVQEGGHGRILGAHLMTFAERGR
jgi:hypothetical protein